MLIGCGGPREKRVVVLINGNSPYWDAVRAGMVAGERDFKLGDAGLKAVMEVNDGTAARADQQAAAVRQPVGHRRRGRFAAGCQQSGRGRRNARVAKTRRPRHHARWRSRPRTLSRRPQVSISAPTTYAAGEQAGHLLPRICVPDGGDYVDFVGRTGAQNAIERMDGCDGGRAAKSFTSAIGWPTISIARRPGQCPQRAAEFSGPEAAGRHLVVQRAGDRRRRQGDRQAARS